MYHKYDVSRKKESNEGEASNYKLLFIFKYEFWTLQKDYLAATMLIIINVKPLLDDLYNNDICNF